MHETILREKLAVLASSDIELLVLKGREYGDSWKKRGGVGAYMMLARKWDRIEKAVKENGYDVFEAIANVPGLADDLQDLGCYLWLVRSEQLGVIHPSGNPYVHIEADEEARELAREFLDKTAEIPDPVEVLIDLGVEVDKDIAHQVQQEIPSPEESEYYGIDVSDQVRGEVETVSYEPEDSGLLEDDDPWGRMAEPQLDPISPNHLAIGDSELLDRYKIQFQPNATPGERITFVAHLRNHYHRLRINKPPEQPLSVLMATARCVKSYTYPEDESPARDEKTRTVIFPDRKSVSEPSAAAPT